MLLTILITTSKIALQAAVFEAAAKSSLLLAEEEDKRATRMLARGEELAVELSEAYRDAREKRRKAEEATEQRLAGWGSLEQLEEEARTLCAECDELRQKVEAPMRTLLASLATIGEIVGDDDAPATGREAANVLDLTGVVPDYAAREEKLTAVFRRTLNAVWDGDILPMKDVPHIPQVQGTLSR